MYRCIDAEMRARTASAAPPQTAPCGLLGSHRGYYVSNRRDAFQPCLPPIRAVPAVDHPNPKRNFIPDDELQILMALSFLADECAEDGDPDAGFRKLLHGLNRACAARRSGAVWGSELVTRYSEELLAYSARHLPRRVEWSEQPVAVH